MLCNPSLIQLFETTVKVDGAEEYICEHLGISRKKCTYDIRHHVREKHGEDKLARLVSEKEVKWHNEPLKVRL